MHRIEVEAELSALGAARKTHTAWPFLMRLHRMGRRTAQAWLESNFTHRGRRAALTLDPHLQ